MPPAMPFADHVLPALAAHPWRLHCPFLPIELEMAEVPDHQAWSAGHAHAHAYREVLIAVRGNGLYGVDGRVWHCPPGAVIFFDAFEPHDLGYPPPAEPVEHLWLSVLPAQIFVRRLVIAAESRGWSDAATWVVSRPTPEIDLHAAWNRARDDTALPPAARRLRLLATLDLLFARVAEDEAAADPAPRPSVAATAVDAVCRHLEETAGRGASLDTLARLAGYSKYHFLRLFKAQTGTTVQTYIDRCRRRRAHELQSRHYTQAAIAEELGFATAASYSRWHRKQAEAKA